MKLSSAKGVLRRASQGGWIKDFPFEGLAGLALKVRSLRCPDVVARRGALVAALPTDQQEKIPPDVAETIATTLMAEDILVDWNVTDDDDQPVHCTPEVVHATLADPEIGGSMRAAIAWAADRVAQHGDDTLKADEKN